MKLQDQCLNMFQMKSKILTLNYVIDDYKGGLKVLIE